VLPLVIAGLAAALPFESPAGWQARVQAAAPTSAAPSTDLTYDLLPPAALHLRGTLTIFSGRVSDGELEQAAGDRHQARVKNRVAWGMKAAGGPPREALKAGARRAVRWRDRVGGALGAGEQLMTCAVAGSKLACVVTIGPPESSDAAEAAAAAILSSLRAK
jgi:hypothetical protein